MAAENKFNEGDTVTLKSGGPKMTIKKVYAESQKSVSCCWFDSTGNYHERDFQSATLKKPSAGGGGAVSFR